jgi:hypothetical protein
MATVFFLIIRGGFMSTSPDRETSLVIIAIGALTGLFSQQAALKLQDIANAVLSKPEPGENSRPQVASSQGAVSAPSLVAAISPDHGKKEGGTLVQILGSGFSSVKSLTFGGVAASDITFDATTSTIIAKTPTHDQGVVDVVVIDNSNKYHILKYRYD